MLFYLAPVAVLYVGGGVYFGGGSLVRIGDGGVDRELGVARTVRWSCPLRLVCDAVGIMYVRNGGR